MISPWLAVLVLLFLFGFRVEVPAWLAWLLVLVWVIVDLRQAELRKRRRRREWIRAAARREEVS